MIIVSAQVLLVLTLGLWTLGLGLDNNIFSGWVPRSKDLTGSDSDCKTKPFKFITLNGNTMFPNLLLSLNLPSITRIGQQFAAREKWENYCFCFTFYLQTVKTNDYQCIDVIGKDLFISKLPGLDVEVQVFSPLRIHK